MFEIFSSDMVEDDVKKSALDQLAIMLQGRSLFFIFNPHLPNLLLKYIVTTVCTECSPGSHIIMMLIRSGPAQGL